MAENEDLVVVHRPPNFVAANMIKGILENAGIEVSLRSLQIPMHDDIMQTSLGCWGEILVRKKDAGRAQKIILQYLETIKDSELPDKKDTK